MSDNHRPMPEQDKDFWIAVALWGAALVTVLGCGLYAFIEQSYGYGGIFTLVGLCGLIYMTFHLKGRRLSGRVGGVALMLAITWGLIGYRWWHAPQQPLPAPAAGLSGPAAFTPTWLTPDRWNTFRSGVNSIINANGNLPSTKVETVAEPQTGIFANTLTDMFITSGFTIQVDSQGSRVGVPTPSLAARHNHRSASAEPRS
jgi:hypothetical protein